MLGLQLAGQVRLVDHDDQALLDARIGGPSPDSLDLVASLEHVERDLIERAMDKARGVKTEAARLLGIKTSALYYKLEKYGLG